MKENEFVHYSYDLYYYYDVSNGYATDGVTKDYFMYKDLRTMEEVRQHIQRTISDGGLTVPISAKGHYNCLEAYCFIPYNRITLIEYYKIK